MRRYMKVEWHHEFEDEPVLLLSEIDGGYETRKVEIYRDGRTDYADSKVATGSTVLAEGLMPTVEDISSDEEFTAHEIGGEEFEELWHRVTDDE
jgi:hypothetical protein